MCMDPATMTVISMGMQALSTVQQVQVGNQARSAASARGEYEAAVARNNMILANRMADDAIARGKVEEAQQRRQTRLMIGQQRVRLAGHGVEVDTGTALEITEDTAAFGELDALTIRRNAEREAMGYRTQGLNYQAAGDLAIARSRLPNTTLGTILTGGSSLAARYGTFVQQRGKTPPEPYPDMPF